MVGQEGWVQLLTSADDLARIEVHLSSVLKRTLCADGFSSLSSAIIDYVTAGGKRLRPQLTLWTWRHLVAAEPAAREGPGEPPAALMDIASAWEIFHAFLLAHDDIIDNGDTRRAKPSLHRQLALLDSGSSVFGTNLAIVAGDLLFGAAMRLFHEVDLPPQPYRDVLRLFSRVACTTGFGQAIDICQSHVPLDAVAEETLLREYHWKTAAYTFEGPMLSGAIVAGVGADAQAAISRFALALGQAYQMHNDVIDLHTPASEGSDIAQGKRTITLIRHRAALGSDDRRLFDHRLASAQQPSAYRLADVEHLRRQMIDAGADRKTLELVADFLHQAACAADDAALQTQACRPLAVAMRGMLAQLGQTYFSTPVGAGSLTPTTSAARA